MGKKRDNQRQESLFIDYRELGTISIDELAQAIYTDIQALKDIYNVKYVTAHRRGTACPLTVRRARLYAARN